MGRMSLKVIRDFCVLITEATLQYLEREERDRKFLFVVWGKICIHRKRRDLSISRQTILVEDSFILNIRSSLCEILMSCYS